MVERVTTGDNLGTICAGHLIGGNLVEDINKAPSQHLLLLMGSGQENITVEPVNKNTIKEKHTYNKVYFRLRKARYPTSSWGVVDMELWFCV
jgi:hypothetical protein